MRKRGIKIKFLLAPFFVIMGFVAFVVFYHKLDPNILADISFYQNIANPSVRIVAIVPGLRREQTAEVIAKELYWNEAQKTEFLEANTDGETTNLEGRYFPKTYFIDKDASPVEASDIMLEEFETQISKIRKPKETALVNEEIIIKIASIIQREAAGKSDMNLISGIVWNRFWKKNMPLQIDATLQYVKGNAIDGWWPPVKKQDKALESPYNTYLYKGLPPGAIANPGIDAIRAAYNPAKTKCLFYLHKNRKIYCSEDYAGHVNNINQYLK